MTKVTHAAFTAYIDPSNPEALDSSFVYGKSTIVHPHASMDPANVTPEQLEEANQQYKKVSSLLAMLET
jgi:hypothetical protein